MPSKAAVPKVSAAGKVLVPAWVVADLLQLKCLSSVYNRRELIQEEKGYYTLESLADLYASRKNGTDGARTKPGPDSDRVKEARDRKAVAEADKAEADARKAEIELERLKGTLVDLSEVQKSLDTAFTTVKTRMRQIPLQMAPLLANTDESTIRDELLQAIDESLENLSRWQDEEAPDDYASGDP